MLRARIELLDTSERRMGSRSAVDSASTARGPEDAAVDVVVKDMSATGLSFVTSSHNWGIGSRISVGLAGAGRVSATVVRRERDLYGCAFDSPLTPKQLADAFSTDVPAVHELGFRQREAPAEEKWPVRTRLIVIIGLALLSWAAIFAIAFA